MNLETNIIPRNERFQLQPVPGNTYSLSPLPNTVFQALPSASPPSVAYNILPSIGHNKVQPTYVPQPVAYSAPPVPPQSAAAVSSSCKPWVVAVCIVAASLVIGGVAVAIVVATNNNGTAGNTDVICGFTCHDSTFVASQCISSSFVCDGDWDCFFGEDESGCNYLCDGFTCSSGTSDGTGCITSSWVCDGFNDCFGGEDELGCFATIQPTPFNCPSGYHYCDGICLDGYLVCDGFSHCSDGSDEYGCSSSSCYGYTCPNGAQHGTSDCISLYWLCDGIIDCQGGYDEQNCYGSTSTYPTSTVSNCLANEILCDGNCIPTLHMCDGHAHCSNGADEVGCSTSCSSDQFYCNSGSHYGYYGYCIPNYWQCDNYDDCSNGEDELNCAAAICSGSQFTCNNGGIYGNCIPMFWVCDGYQDCSDAADELSCTTECDTTQFKCENGGVFGICMSSSHQCNGMNDCYDGADEHDCDNLYACPDPSSSSSQKILKTKVCDGTEDCPGGADEDRCIISQSGDSGLPLVFSVETLSHHPICAQGWTTEKSNSTCVALGFSSSANTKTVHSDSMGITCDGEFLLEVFTQKSPALCPGSEVIEISCTREAVCGGTTRNIRVVGGEDATAEEHPWQVSLQQGSDTTSWNHFCGGTMISEKWVVTSAHCVPSIFPFNYEYFRVAAGITRLSEPIQDINQYQILNVITHPLYDVSSVSMDIALIQVSTSFVESSTIQPACLPAPGQVFNDQSLVSVSGWGSTAEGGGTTDVLQEASVPLYNTESCRTTFTSLTHYIKEGMICAGLEEGGKDTCQGDSGGPLIAEISGIKYLGGVTSWGFGCARPNKPGVYAEVSYARDWIKREMQKAGG